MTIIPIHDPDKRFWEQLHVVNEEMRRLSADSAGPGGAEPQDAIVAGPYGAAEGSGIKPEYAYLAQHIIMRGDGTGERDNWRSSRLEQLAADGRGPLVPVTDDSDPTALVRYRIGDRDLDETLAFLNDVGTRTDLPHPRATRVHLVSIAGVTLCPGDEPVPVNTALIPPVRGDSAGAGVAVRVIDTGLIQRFKEQPSLYPWMSENVTGDGRKSQTDPKGFIRQYVGHGTFIAGVLKCVAPGVQVRVSNALPHAGAVLEDDLGRVLVEVLDGEPEVTEHQKWPPIVSLSAGATTEGGLPLVGLDPFVRKLREHPETLLVAAAGNDGRDVPFWPAAFAGPGSYHVDGVLSVGALREDGRGRACFSNHGDWVSVYAPGERLVNAFGSGAYQYEHSHSPTCRYSGPPHPTPLMYHGCTCVAPYQKDEVVPFDGLARWSGTSFATPIVAGLIAARMWQTRQEEWPGRPETSRQAAAALLASAVSTPDLGVFAPATQPETT